MDAGGDRANNRQHVGQPRPLVIQRFRDQQNQQHQQQTRAVLQRLSLELSSLRSRVQGLQATLQQERVQIRRLEEELHDEREKVKREEQQTKDGIKTVLQAEIDRLAWDMWVEKGRLQMKLHRQRKKFDQEVQSLCTVMNKAQDELLEERGKVEKLNWLLKIGVAVGQGILLVGAAVAQMLLR